MAHFGELPKLRNAFFTKPKVKKHPRFFGQNSKLRNSLTLVEDGSQLIMRKKYIFDSFILVLRKLSWDIYLKLFFKGNITHILIIYKKKLNY